MPQGDIAREITAESKQPDREVLETLRSGDRRRALALLMRAHGPVVRRFCLDLLGDANVADDVAQTTFVQAFEDLSRFAERATFKAWLLGIARHRCLDLLKSKRHWLKVVSDDKNAPDVADEGPSPEARIALGRLTTAVAHCLEALPIAMREAVSLRYRQGLSYDEMAAALRERAGTLRVRVARALPLLRRCLQQKGVEP